jgi:hypothetical protein
MQQPKVIKSKILKSEKVNWKSLKQIQKDNFKDLTKEDFEKLKASIVNNNFIESFKIWQDKDTLWILDGTHRIKALHILESQGYMIPEKFNADFIECADKKEAAKLVTIYSSIYAKVTDEGFYEFLSEYNLNFEDLKLEIDIPNIDLEKFEIGYVEKFDPESIDLGMGGEAEKKCPHCGGILP